MNTPDLKDYWREHRQAWKVSGLSQKEYCRQHKLKPGRLCYWKRIFSKDKIKIKPRSAAPEAHSAFVPLALESTVPSTEGLSIRLPNGCELSGVESHHLPELTQLIKALL